MPKFEQTPTSGQGESSAPIEQDLNILAVSSKIDKAREIYTNTTSFDEIPPLLDEAMENAYDIKDEEKRKTAVSEIEEKKINFYPQSHHQDEISGLDIPAFINPSKKEIGTRFKKLKSQALQEENVEKKSRWSFSLPKFSFGKKNAEEAEDLAAQDKYDEAYQAAYNLPKEKQQRKAISAIEQEKIFAEFAKHGELDAITPERDIELPTFISRERPNTLEEAAAQEAQEKEIIEEIQKMPTAEQEKLGFSLSSFGYQLEEGKNKKFAQFFNYLASNRKEGSALDRFFTSLANDAQKKAEQAHLNREQISKGDTKHLGNVGHISSNVLKYGRNVADIVGWTAASPLRFAMIGAQGLTRVSSAALESRLGNAEIADKRLVADIDEAADQAWALYKKLEAENSGAAPSAEQLSDAYKKNLPKDILERLKKQTGDANVLQRFTTKILETDVAQAVNTIQNQIDDIEKDTSLSPVQKEMEIESILDKYKTVIDRYDRMVSNAGTVDGLAYGLKSLEFASKTATVGLMLETADLAVEKIWESAGSVFADTEQAIEEEVRTEAKDTTQKPAAAPRPAVQDTLASQDTAQKITQAPAGPKVNAESIFNAPVTDVSSVGEVAQDTTETPKVAPTPESVTPKAPEDIEAEKFVGEVKEGGNAWKAVHSLVEKGVITEEQFNEAIHNPKSGFTDKDGNFAQFLKLGLTHAGDKFEYVAGENGEPGLIRAVDNPADNFEIGSDEDYAKYLHSKGKPLPAWLAESVGEVAEKEIPAGFNESITPTYEMEPDYPGVETIPHVVSEPVTIEPAVDKPIASPRDIVIDFKHDINGNPVEMKISHEGHRAVTEREIKSVFKKPNLEDLKIPPGMTEAQVRTQVNEDAKTLVLLKRYIDSTKAEGTSNTPETEFAKRQANNILDKTKTLFGDIYKARLIPKK